MTHPRWAGGAQESAEERLCEERQAREAQAQGLEDTVARGWGGRCICCFGWDESLKVMMVNEIDWLIDLWLIQLWLINLWLMIIHHVVDSIVFDLIVDQLVFDLIDNDSAFG